MSLLRFVSLALVAASVSGSADGAPRTSTRTSAPAVVAERAPERAPRVEIGEAVLTIYDDSGRVIAVE